MRPSVADSSLDSTKLTTSSITHTTSASSSSGSGGTTCDADSEVSTTTTSPDEDSDMPDDARDPLGFRSTGRDVPAVEMSSPDARSFESVFVDDEEGYESSNEHEQTDRSRTRKSSDEGREGTSGGGRKRLSFVEAIRRANAILGAGTRSPRKKADKPTVPHTPRKRFGFLSNNVEKPWDHQVFNMPNRRVSPFGAALGPLKRRFIDARHARGRSKSLELACPPTPTPSLSSRMTLESHVSSHHGILASASTPAKLNGILLSRRDGRISLTRAGEHMGGGFGGKSRRTRSTSPQRSVTLLSPWGDGVLELSATLSRSTLALESRRFPEQSPVLGSLTTASTSTFSSDVSVFRAGRKQTPEGLVTRAIFISMAVGVLVGLVSGMALLLLVADHAHSGFSLQVSGAVVDRVADAWRDVHSSVPATVRVNVGEHPGIELGEGEEVQTVWLNGKGLDKDGPIRLKGGLRGLCDVPEVRCESK